MTKIAVFVGSLQQHSLNKKLAHAIEARLPAGIEFDYIDFAGLPLFSQEAEQDFPAAARKIKDTVEAADGVLFVTPEYNRGIPGGLKNAIDWTTRPSGDNSFAGKPVAVTGATGGPWGTGFAQTQLKSILLYLDTHVLGQPELYVAFAKDNLQSEGQIDEHTAERLQHFVNAFTAHVAAYKK